MKSKATYILFLLFLIVFTFQTLPQGLLFAQGNNIVLNQSNLDANIGTSIELTYYTYTDQASTIAIINQTGADQTWDFSTFVVEDSISATGTLEFFDSFSGEPGSDESHFSNANVMIKADIESSFEESGMVFNVNLINYSYSGLSSASLVDYGVYTTNTTTIAGNPTTSVFITRNTPAKIVYPFPLDYETTWNYTYDFENSGSGNPTTTEYTIDAEVDGWGKVVIGTIEIPVLRVTEIQTSASVGFNSVSAYFIDQSGFQVASAEVLEDPITGAYSADPGSIQVALPDNLTAVSSETSPDIPTSISLDQNYPNPFNPTTQISYQLDSPSEVSLSIYSITGQKVRTLVNGEFKQAGEYSVSFDATNLASGMYIYRLRAGDQMFTRKMTLLK